MEFLQATNILKHLVRTSVQTGKYLRSWTESTRC